MAKLMARYRVTVDLTREYVDMLEVLMDQDDLRQSDVIRAALAEYYAAHVTKDDPSDE